MQLIDIGANLGHDSFDHDREQVIAEAKAAGLSAMIVTGTSVAASAKAAPGGVIALTGISAVPATEEVNLSLFNKRMVLENKVLFGSVNAARSHYEAAARVLADADPTWLGRLISRRVPADNWPEALQRQPDDVKVVMEIAARDRAA